MAVPRTLAFLRQGTGSQVLETYANPPSHVLLARLS